MIEMKIKILNKSMICDFPLATRSTKEKPSCRWQQGAPRKNHPAVVTTDYQRVISKM
jgi:hypothetical protein